MLSCFKDNSGYIHILMNVDEWRVMISDGGEEWWVMVTVMLLQLKMMAVMIMMMMMMIIHDDVIKWKHFSITVLFDLCLN